MQRTLASVIRELRHKRGETLESFAVALHCAAPTVSSWEQDRKVPSPPMLQRLIEISKPLYPDAAALFGRVLNGDLTPVRLTGKKTPVRITPVNYIGISVIEQVSEVVRSTTEILDATNVMLRNVTDPLTPFIVQCHDMVDLLERLKPSPTPGRGRPPKPR